MCEWGLSLLAHSPFLHSKGTVPTRTQGLSLGFHLLLLRILDTELVVLVDEDYNGEDSGINQDNLTHSALLEMYVALILIPAVHLVAKDGIYNSRELLPLGLAEVSLH